MIILSSIILIISVIYFFIQLKKNEISISEVYNKGIDDLKRSSTSANMNKFSKIRVTILYFTFILFVLMLISSFIPTMFTLEHLTGLFLVIHVTIAPLFAISLALLILFYSHRLRLNNHDYKLLVNRKNNQINFSVIKLAYWLGAFFAIPLLLSIILILFPILGTDLQDFYITVHRISALLFTILTLILLYYILVIKKQNHSK